METKGSYLYRNTTSKEKRMERISTKARAEKKIRALQKEKKLPENPDFILSGWNSSEFTVIFSFENDNPISEIQNACDNGKHVMEYVRAFTNAQNGKPSVELYFAY